MVNMTDAFAIAGYTVAATLAAVGSVAAAAQLGNPAVAFGLKSSVNQVLASIGLPRIP